MVLAAGRGRRMGALTHRLPKPLLRVGGTSLIARHLERLAALGVGEVVINVSWRGERLRAALGSGSAWGLAIHYSEEGAAPLETAGGIVAALPLLGSEPFLVINGDILTDHPLQLAPLSSGQLGRLVLVDNPPHHPRGDFALREGRVVRGEPRLTFAGISLLHPRLFRGLPQGVRPLGPLLQSQLDAGTLAGEHHRGYWSDVGTPARLGAAERHLRAGAQAGSTPTR